MGTTASQLLDRIYIALQRWSFTFVNWMAMGRLIIPHVYKNVSWSENARQVFNAWTAVEILDIKNCCCIRLHCWLSFRLVLFSIEGVGCVQRRCLFFLCLAWKGWAQGRSGSASTLSIKQWPCFQHIPSTFFMGAYSIKQSAAHYETFNGGACWP